MNFKLKDLMIKVLPENDADKSALSNSSSPFAPRHLAQWPGYHPGSGPIRWPGSAGGINAGDIGRHGDCGNCSGCSNCSGCTSCSPCTGCTSCTGCTGCSDCSGCTGCSGCTACGSLGCTSSCYVTLFSDNNNLPDDLNELDKIREEINELMSAIDKQTERIETSMQPKSIEELDQLEQHLLNSLEELKAQRDKLK